MSSGCLLVARELDEQDRVRLAADRLVHGRAEGCDVARQLDHRPVDELYGRGPEPDDVPREVHRLIESREVHHAEHLVRRQRRKLELDLAEQPKRSFGADEQLREIERVRRRQVEVVAGHAPLQLRDARFDLVPLARVQLAHLGDELAVASRAGRWAGGDGAARQRFAAREPRLDLEDVVHHVAVTQRASAAAVVRRHAADRGLRRRRDIDRVPEAELLQAGVQLVEDDAGLDRGGAALRVDLQQPVQVLAGVDDECGTDGLAALRRAGAARQDRHAGRHGGFGGADGLVGRARHDDAERLDLVDRRIRRIATAIPGVE